MLVWLARRPNVCPGWAGLVPDTAHCYSSYLRGLNGCCHKKCLFRVTLIDHASFGLDKVWDEPETLGPGLGDGLQVCRTVSPPCPLALGSFDNTTCQASGVSPARSGQ